MREPAVGRTTEQPAPDARRTRARLASVFALAGTVTPLMSGCGEGSAPPAQIELLAGGLGGPGNVNGTGADARFEDTGGIAVDDEGFVYVGDGPRIRKISPTGEVTSYATVSAIETSVPGGELTAASLALDSARMLYAAANDGRVFKIASDGVVSSLPGLPPTSAIAVDSSDALIGATTTTIPGPGGTFWKMTAAGLSQLPYIAPGAPLCPMKANIPPGINGLTTDASGNLYATGYLFDYLSQVFEVSPAGTVTTWSVNCSPLQGNTIPPGPSPVVRVPGGIAVGGSGSFYVSDLFGGIFVYTSPPTSAPLKLSDIPAVALALDREGTLYLSDATNNVVRKITTDGQPTTIAGRSSQAGYQDGAGSEARFSFIGALAVDRAGNLHVADNAYPGALQYIREVTPLGTVSTEKALSLPGSLNALALDSAGDTYLTGATDNAIWRMTPGGNAEIFAGSSGDSGALDGFGSAARFTFPRGLAVDGHGNLFVADTGNSTIRKIDPAGMVTTLAGQAGEHGHQDGHGSTARFDSPTGIAVDSRDDVFVVDTVSTLVSSVPGGGDTYECSYTVRMITGDATVSTLARLPSQTLTQLAQNGCSSARWITVGPGRLLYVSDPDNAVIYEVEASGKVLTIAGTPGSVGVSLGPLPGSLSRPQGLVYANSTLYIADVGEHSLLQIPYVP